jgi:dipeptidyl aminopeptidase/acylaminoacyl peptidase
VIRAFFWLAGLFVLLAVAWVHGLTATAGNSMATLYALWLFVPAPAVYVWQGLRPWPRLQPLGKGYLAVSAVLSVMVLGGVAWIGSERTIHPKPGNEPSLQEYPLPVERIEFQAPDGTKRVGWFIPGRTVEPSSVVVGFIPEHGPGSQSPLRATVLILSGYGGTKAGMLRHANFLHERGFNTLVFDFRNRGESEGSAVTLGYYEQDEALAALGYLKTRPDVDPQRIGLLGASMGAATAILAAARSEDFRAVVADSPFKSAESVVGQSFQHFINLPPFPYAPITLQILAWRTGITPKNIVPLAVVDRISPRPLLLIHGTGDTTINYEASKQLYERAGEPKELWLIPDIGHTQGMQKAPEEYAERVSAFFDRWLPQ